MAAGELVALGDLALLGHEHADELVHTGRQVVARGAREGLDVDHHAALAVRDLERGVADLARLLLEDRADQLLLGRQLGLALRRDLADQQVARLDLGADADDAAVVEVAQRLLRAVRDVARDLLVAELGGAGVDLVLLDVDRGELVVLDQALGEDDRVLEVVALPGHEGDLEVLAQGHLALVGRRAVREHVARLDLLARDDARLLVDQRALVGAHELLQLELVPAVVRREHDAGGVDEVDRARMRRDDHVARVDRGAALHARADQRGVRLEQRHRLALHVRAHQRAVGVVVLEERDHRRGDRPDLLRRDVDQVDVVGRVVLVVAGLGAAQDRVAGQLALRVDGLVGLRDPPLLLLRRVEVLDLVGDDPLLDDAVGRRHEAELRHLGEARQGADQADVRALRRLDRAHAAVVGRVHVAHLDRRALAREAAGAEGAEAPPVRQAGQAVRLVHELAELGGAEELLQRGHDRADVDDRLRRDRVRVLGREALADDALHPVEADAEGLLDELADGAQAAVAEVLVLVEVVGDRLARHRDRLGGVVLGVVGLLGHAEDLRQLDELAHERDDVVLGQRARLEVDVEAEALVELVAPDAREVVALGIEEELVEQVARVVDARRLARALLAEQLDQRALLGAGLLRVGLDRVLDVERVPEATEDLLVRHAHRAQQHGDRQLALAVDADVDAALLVDLELEPAAPGRHQVGHEQLLLRVLRVHQVGARRADELRDDHALGAVDDERAPVGHPREVAHEHGLLPDLTRLAVDEADGDRQRARVGEVLLAALLERRHGGVELELAELDGEVAGVVLDRRDVVDRLSETALLRVDEPVEGLLLDVDQVRDVEDVFEPRERATRAGSIN